MLLHVLIRTRSSTVWRNRQGTRQISFLPLWALVAVLIMVNPCKPLRAGVQLDTRTSHRLPGSLESPAACIKAFVPDREVLPIAAAMELKNPPDVSGRQV